MIALRIFVIASVVALAMAACSEHTDCNQCIGRIAPSEKCKWCGVEGDVTGICEDAGEGECPEHSLKPTDVCVDNCSNKTCEDCPSDKCRFCGIAGTGGGKGKCSHNAYPCPNETDEKITSAASCRKVDKVDCTKCFDNNQQWCATTKICVPTNDTTCKDKVTTKAGCSGTSGASATLSVGVATFIVSFMGLFK